MSSLLLENLSRSLIIVDHAADFFLNADGSVARHSDLWTSRFIQVLPSFYDSTAANIVSVFLECVDHWTALKNEQKIHLRTVPIEEFDQQIKRICFVGQFIFANRDKIEASPLAKEKTCALLSKLLAKEEMTLESAEEIVPVTLLKQLDPAMNWKREEASPMALTPEILKIPAPQIDLLESTETTPSIAELPAFYYELVTRTENCSWPAFFLDWMWWYGPHAISKAALAKMCSEILNEPNKPNHALANLFLGRLLALFKSKKIPDLQIRTCLDELVLTSHQCPTQWASDAERHYLSLTGKEETLLHKVLHWKRHFIDQQLFRFFSTVYTRSEDRQNAHLMNTLLFHYGENLGEQTLQAPSIDLHVLRKPPLEYQWVDVFCYLESAWQKESVESFLTYSELNKWQADIGQFLTVVVQEKLPGIEDPSAFVLTEYFEKQRFLNKRGAIRFLIEIFEIERN